MPNTKSDKLVVYRKNPRNDACYSVTIFIKLTFVKVNAIRSTIYFYSVVAYSSIFLETQNLW